MSSTYEHMEAPNGISNITIYDVVVAGAGPAGVAAAIAAGRTGAQTLLIEPQNALGGVWTSGLLSNILDAENKPGLIVEIRQRLRAAEAISPDRDVYDAEMMKIVLEQLCEEAGVTILLHTKVTGAETTDRRIRQIYVECKEGRRVIRGHNFIDTTGDGDLAAQAGCQFDLGRPSDGLTQPFSLISLVAGVPKYVRDSNIGSKRTTCIPKHEFLDMLRRQGHEPSYQMPSLFPLPNDLCALMVDHQYEFSGLKSMDLTKATLHARKEIHATVEAMKKFSEEWHKVHLVATCAHIGIREGRRIRGLYQISVDDIMNGVKHADAITRCEFGIDVHSVKKSDGGGYSKDGVSHYQSYDIPLRALIAKDIDNLLMAGRCISGDFHAHASYRVTGNAVSTGEAAGTAAALATKYDIAPSNIPAQKVIKSLEKLRIPAPKGVSHEVAP
ncbi:FAD-dependent oxidoreductase [Cerasicoccus fimbriatus]|uniref:FAD-dependent oxidoreductase n=1 Tax=Cerasicoccus fimbriatus TaxID=3014554 RepID=UPI0022B32055|nr:FAD-dependent oxidoreductase [Cerasicoccus sp. TK19100]